MIKRNGRLLLLVTVLLAAMALPAMAADYTARAQELQQLGLFQGTDKGFELDQPLRRDEAAALLVRLLGKEEEAQKENYEHPFTDVARWASPYVGYLYHKELSKGVSSHEFGSAQRCSGQDYLTFVLRALGYYEGENKDFTYEKAVEFSQELGLCQPSLFPTGFLRNQAVAVSYAALAQPVRGADGRSLLDELVRAGAVDERDAGALMDKVKAYRAYLKRYQAAKVDLADGMELRGEANVRMSVPYIGGSYYLSAAVQSSSLVTKKGAQAAITLAFNSKGMDGTSAIYLKDGYLYREEDGIRVRRAIDPAYTVEQMMGFSPLALFYDVDQAEQSGTDVIQLVYGSGYRQTLLLDLVGQIMETEPELINAGPMTVKLTFGKQDRLDRVDLIVEATGRVLQQEVICKANMRVEVRARGEDVTVDLPDLKHYQDASPSGGAAGR